MIYCPDPPSRKDLLPICWEYVSRQPAAVSPLWELPQLQGTTQPRSHPFMGLPISNDLPVQDYKVVLLPILGQLWRSFRLQSSPWCRPRLLLDLRYTSAFPSTHSCFFPSFYKYWSQALFLINILQVKLHLRVCILENPVWDAPLPSSVCPPKHFFTEYLTSTGLGNTSWMLVSTSVRTG